MCARPRRRKHWRRRDRRLYHRLRRPSCFLRPLNLRTAGRDRDGDDEDVADVDDDYNDDEIGKGRFALSNTDTLI